MLSVNCPVQGRNWAARQSLWGLTRQLLGADKMTTTLCETCRNVREVRTARSQFLLCELSVTNAAYPKYPPQPVLRCDGYQSRSEAMQDESDDPPHKSP
jgi:hypothetical protein